MRENLPTGTVTFLFTDIEGSTRLLQELGQDYRALQDEHGRIVRDAIAEGEGVEIRTEGDSFFAVFPTTVGALRAAVRAQRGLAAHDWPDGRSIRVRMGLHTGEGRLGGDDYLGIDVNRAARIAAAGHGGQLLLSDATRALVEHDLPDGVRLRDLGTHRLKDLAQPVHMWQADVDGLPIEFPALATLDARPTNLPPELTTFVGRHREIDRLKELIGSNRLVTLTGPGGTGKTRLALHVGVELLDEFRDGVLLVDLSSIADPALVPAAVAQALEVQEQPGRPLIEGMKDAIRDRQLLLIMDNFEQVTEAAAVVHDLLVAASRLHVLVTSRVVLHLYGEQEVHVPPLELPDAERVLDVPALSQYEAVALFVDRARSVKPDFEVTNDNAPAVAEITARLDGLPLAIELAASRVRLLTPQAMLPRLQKRLSLLAAGARNVPERQRTLRGAIDWSYDLLDEPERRLFARLSVFAGGWTLEAAERVALDEEPEMDVLDALGSLVEKSLVRQTETPDGEPRFMLLETIREYAAQRLAESGEEREIRRRHAEHYTAFAEEAEPHLLAEDQATWLDRCEREHDNVRAALGWSVEAGEAEIGQRLAAALWRFWSQRGPIWEGRRWLERVLALGPTPPDVRIRATIAAGGIVYWNNDFDAATRHYGQALLLAREAGDRSAEMESLYNLGWTEMVKNEDPELAERLFLDARAIAEKLGDRAAQARADTGIASLRIQIGEPGDAIPRLEAALAVQEQLGNRWEVLNLAFGLGQGYRLAGRPELGGPHYRRALRMALQAGNLPMAAVALKGVAAVDATLGRAEAAARMWGASEAIGERVGGLRGEAPMEGVLDSMREALGDEGMERPLAEGRRMSLEEAVRLARADDEPALG